MSRFALPSATLIAFVVLSFSPAVEAQPSKQGKSCSANSRIELSKLATLKDDRERGALPLHPMLIARTRNGQYVMPSADATKLFLFDGTGQITKTLGEAAGQRFSMITVIHGAPDGSLYVYDRAARTMFVFDDQLALRRNYPFRYHPALLLGERQYIHAEQIPTPQLAGQPLHTLDETGSTVRSFGFEGGMYRADEPFRYNRVVTGAAEGLLWAAAPGTYLLERWDPLRGTKNSAVRVESSWFLESAQPPRGGEKPSPIIEALWEVDGCVWVLLRDADSQWRTEESTKTERRFDPDRYDRTYDFVLEVVATASGKVVASRRLDSALWGLGSSFILMTRRVSAEGSTEIDVWRPRLVRKEGK